MLAFFRVLFFNFEFELLEIIVPPRPTMSTTNHFLVLYISLSLPSVKYQMRTNAGPGIKIRKYSFEIKSY